jgi:hypothetical protein
MKNIHWGSVAIGVAIAWFGLPLIQSFLAKAKSA